MFTRATKRTAKLRAALFGPSGSGKTFSALRIAKGLGGRVAVIDTERGSASKYADRFEFDVFELARKTIPDYVAAIGVAQAAGYEILVLDSLSHAWQELLEEVDRIAKARFKGNSWGAWSEGTPMQRSLVDAMLGFPGHVLATMRSKTEWSVDKADGGKSRPVRVGLAPEQGKGIEYEFDLLLELSPDHVCTVLKDRTSRFQDRVLEKPGEELGRELAAWLAEGTAPAPTPPPEVVTTVDVQKGGAKTVSRKYPGGEEARSPDSEQQEFDKTFPPGAVPPPAEKPRSRNFKLLKAMRELKASLGESEYRRILGEHGYAHADQILGKAAQEKVFRALKERADGMTTKEKMDQEFKGDDLP